MAKAAAKLRVVGLRALRERAGLSRMDLVRLLRVSVDPQTIYRLETGRSKDTSLDTAKAIAEALSKELGEDVTVYDLFPEEAGRFLNDLFSGIGQTDGPDVHLLSDIPDTPARLAG